MYVSEKGSNTIPDRDGKSLVIGRGWEGEEKGLEELEEVENSQRQKKNE